MNRSDLPRISKVAASTVKLLDRHGRALWDATKDWESPLRSGGAAGPKGEHSDPTPAQVINPDPLTLEHAALLADLEAFNRAAQALASRLIRLTPIDPRTITRGRVNLVPSCIVCAGPAIPIRRGMCDTDYRAWRRAGMPDLTTFKLSRRSVPWDSDVPADLGDPCSGNDTGVVSC